MKVNKKRLEAASAYFNSKLNFMDYLEKYNLLEGSATTNQGVAINCPFHYDWDPSFKIDLNRNLYKCFACGEDGGGDLIKFISRYESNVLGNKLSYASVIENFLKSNRQYCVDLGFSSVYDDSSVDLEAIRSMGLKKFKLNKSRPKTFLSLSSYIKSNGTVDDMMTAMKLMQEGFSAEVIFEMMYSIKSDSNLTKEFSGMRLDEFLKEE